MLIFLPIASSRNGDYTKTAKSFMFSNNNTRQCFSIQLIEDAIVERNETFVVQLEQINASDDLTFKPEPEYTEVIILDNDGRILFAYKISKF